MGFDIARIYTESKGRIDAGTYDERDEAIVALWNTATQAVRESAQVSDSARKKRADESFASDISETRATLRLVSSLH